jgi:hypothetical protein
MNTNSKYFSRIKLNSKFITYTLFFLVNIILSAIFASKTTYAPLSHNPQGVYCNYEKLDKVTNKIRKVNIDESGWKSQGSPCILTLKFYYLYLFLFFAMFLFLWLIVAILKSK